MFNCCSFFFFFFLALGGFHITDYSQLMQLFSLRGDIRAQCCSRHSGAAEETERERERGRLLFLLLSSSSSSCSSHSTHKHTHTHTLRHTWCWMYKADCFDASAVTFRFLLPQQSSSFPATWPRWAAARLCLGEAHLLRTRNLRRW